MPKNRNIQKKKKVKFLGDVSVKETFRKLLKAYNQLSALSGKMALPSIRMALREAIDNEIILVKFVVCHPEPELNDGSEISIVPFIKALRHERFIHIRLFHVWNVPLTHDDIIALTGLLEKKIYLLKHIELTDCLIEPYGLQRLCLAINCCSTMTSLVLDYNEFGDEGCRSLCAGLRGNRTLLSVSMCFCNLTATSGEYLSILISTTAVSDLYLDGNNLESEGTIQLLRFCVERAIEEADEREMEMQLKVEEEERRLADENQKKWSFDGIQEQVTISQGETTKETNMEKRKKGKKKKENPIPLPPPVGPWIHKLHLADNGIDSMNRPGRSTLFTALESISQLIMYSKCLQEIDLEDNCIGELGGERLVEALQFRSEVSLQNIKLRTTHRISAEALAALAKLEGGGQQMKKMNSKQKKKKN